MNLTPGNRYIFSEADSTHVVDECILLEVSPSKLYRRIQTSEFTVWKRAEDLVFLEDLGKAEKIRNPEWEHTRGYVPLFDRPAEDIKVGPPPRQTATEIVTDNPQPPKTATKANEKDPDIFTVVVEASWSTFRYTFPTNGFSISVVRDAIAKALGCDPSTTKMLE